ncbi:hypothetical protein BDZ89DRAFT_597990 [Hymenopellis radicata]|nr:hypothetical protein BDZ89DRAFT_597990 [Hymenopellis radicata]
MNIKNTTHVELCPRCRASIALTPYTRLPFEEDISRAYRNPSKTDSCAIEGSLTSPIAELATLAEEIQRVEAMLNALKKHHAQLEGHIHRTTRYIQSSPIRQLPTEILVVIFASACTSFQEWEYKTPLSISLVCSKWRDIAMSKPTLWTNIYVAPYSKAYGIPVFKYYLQRCGGIPLSVKVEIPVRARACLDDYDVDTPYEDHYGFRTTTSAHRLVEPIFATFPQWKVADFHMKQADLELLDNHCSNQKFPLLLESLTLATHHPQMDDLPRILCQAPLLSSLTLVDRDESVGLLWMYSAYLGDNYGRSVLIDCWPLIRSSLTTSRTARTEQLLSPRYPQKRISPLGLITACLPDTSLPSSLMGSIGTGVHLHYSKPLLSPLSKNFRSSTRGPSVGGTNFSSLLDFWHVHDAH